MPTYEYNCKECGNNFEAFQSFTDKPLKKHKDGCGGGPVQKVFHARGVVFKGSGFYATDSRKAESTKPPTKVDSDSKTSTADKSPKKESKPAAASAKSDAAD